VGEVGWAQRSRRHLAAGTCCYLCDQTIEPTENWNRDHVPPKRIFASSVRERFSPQLAWLATHVTCNSAYRRDEEYFVLSLAGHIPTPTARAVFKDVQDAAGQGHDKGVLETVVNSFSQVVGAGGERLYSYDGSRVNRFAWKMMRGLYCLELEAVLPNETTGEILVVDPRSPADELATMGWFSAVRNTHSMATFPGVFDYKWLGWVDGAIRGHAVAMLFWNGLIIAMLFHDPTCACSICIESGERNEGVRSESPDQD
jgi:hypothetical protein